MRDSKTLEMPANIREMLVAFLDAYLERHLGNEIRNAYSPGEVNAIAQRIREAHRGKQ